MKSNNDEKSMMPLVITSMAVISPLLVILGIVIGDSLGGGALTSDSMSSWLSAIATVAIAVLTFILAKETWYLRAAQIQQLKELKRENIRPNVGLEFEHSPVGIHFINVKINNFGNGIAKKIRFKFLDRNGDLVSTNEDVLVAKFKNLAMFTVGVESLGIRQVISTFLFSFLDLQKELKGDIYSPYVRVHIIFEDVEGTLYENEFSIDFAQYKGMVELGKNPLNQIANDIQKIQKDFSKITRSNNRIGVNVFSEKDRVQEDESTRDWLAEQMRKE
ncbi:hypothetical protein WG29040_05730 [Pseudomonas sp. PAMC 29040]|uniref:hypothetical protein n=1 Tax=Pseudomonas sp. PAMC 29040 TaxID=2498450 RepID=UPI000FB40379|nr:hypothetical protein [Pseudomonas sp. PAMC 29040]RUT39815.1 hypothetical protein WG29040_05730 [Pseudomonas sp. PAMC 29040]